MAKDQKYCIAQIYTANYGAEIQMQTCLDSTPE